MKRLCKKLTAALLAAAMMTCAAPGSFGGIRLPEPAVTASAAETEAPISGTCGENLTWSFDEATGTLTIEGSGEMEIFSPGDAPWLSVRRKITEVILPEGLTDISGKAFFRCDKLTSITIPESVTRIGPYAFSECTGLTNIIIPESVTYIEYDAFSKTPWLEALLVENPLVVINHSVYTGRTCQGNVVLPDGVTQITSWAFSGCKNLTGITIPDSVTIIGEYAFNGCKELRSITIPNGVKMIEYATFKNCYSLESITLPETVRIIWSEVFLNCKNLTIRGNSGSFAEKYANAERIPFESLGDSTESLSGICGDNLTWNYDETEKKLVIDGIGAMADYDLTCYQTLRYDYSESNSPFPHYIIEAEIKNGVTTIGQNAFHNCSCLKSILVPESVTLISGSVKAPYLGMNYWGYEEKQEHCPTIKGYTGSYAEEYAKANDLKFEALDAEPLWGDVNCDSSVDIADAVLICRFAVADAEAEIT
ncbi:MAG: leucine-rich repeat protein, partial [Clostridia bacterium]|nr:leucine-rich repeat protein [Clostridia bacterium]